MTNFHFLKQSEKKPGELDTWSVILPFAFDLICGILLIALGNLALRVTSYALAGVMIISAIYMIIVYVRSKPLVKITELRLAGGLVLIVAGALLAFNPEYLENLLPFIWGIALLFGAFVKIQYAFDELALKIEKWWIMLILAAFSMVIGILTLANPAFLGENRNTIIGIMLTFLLTAEGRRRRRAAAIIVLVFSLGSFITTAREIHMAPYRQEHFIAMQQAALEYKTQTDKELTRALQYHDADRIRKALGILERQGLNIYRNQN